MEETVYTGLPTMCLLPMNNTKFKIVGNIKIDIPRKGAYNELAPKIFSEEDGSFDVLADNIIYLPSITKILLAENKYPKLEMNQVFTPSVLIFDDDVVMLEGLVLEILTVIK